MDSEQGNSQYAAHQGAAQQERDPRTEPIIKLNQGHAYGFLRDSGLLTEQELQQAKEMAHSQKLEFLQQKLGNRYLTVTEVVSASRPSDFNQADQFGIEITFSKNQAEFLFSQALTGEQHKISETVTALIDELSQEFTTQITTARTNFDLFFRAIVNNKLDLAPAKITLLLERMQNSVHELDNLQYMTELLAGIYEETVSTPTYRPDIWRKFITSEVFTKFAEALGMANEFCGSVESALKQPAAGEQLPRLSYHEPKVEAVLKTMPETQQQIQQIDAEVPEFSEKVIAATQTLYDLMVTTGALKAA